MTRWERMKVKTLNIKTEIYNGLKSKPTIVCTHQLAHCIVMLNLCDVFIYSPTSEKGQICLSKEAKTYSKKCVLLCDDVRDIYIFFISFEWHPFGFTLYGIWRKNQWSIYLFFQINSENVKTFFPEGKWKSAKIYTTERIIKYIFSYGTQRNIHPKK